MKHYSAAAARRQLADALDAAEAGVPVVIERRGVRFLLSREAAPRVPASGPALVEILDPAVECGHWTWAATTRGLRFTPRTRPKARRRA
jgi:hypothetical protein